MFSLDIILQQIVYGLVLGSIYVLIAAGFSFIWGIVGVLNLAHGEFFMIGAYAGYFAAAYWGWNPVFGLMLAMVTAFLIGALLQRLVIEPLRGRKKADFEINTLMMTIGISMFLMNLALILFGPKYRGIPSYFDGTLRLGPIVMSYDRLSIFLVALLLVGLWAVFFKYARVGLIMRAVSENPEAAALAGAPITRILYLSFGMCTALAGAAGALLLPIYNAYPTVGAGVILLALFIVIFGGLGSIRGAVYAGFIIGILESLAVLFVSSGWKDAIVFLIVICVLTFKPHGLSGTKE